MTDLRGKVAGVLRTRWRTALGVVLGGIAGFLYSHYVGCRTGGCAITSNPWLSTLFGSVLGYTLLAEKRPRADQAEPRSQ